MRVGTEAVALVEGYSKRSKEYLSGRIDENAVVIFPKANFSKGDYVKVKITGCTSATLFGELID